MSGQFADSKVMIVDDKQENIDLLADMIEPFKCQVICATSGAEAIDLCKSSKPDLILMDVLMPDLDGFETCEQLKQDSEVEDIPVIFVTANTSVKDLAYGFKVGGVDYIIKPIQPLEVEARVGTHLKSQQLIKLRKKNEQYLAEVYKNHQMILDSVNEGILRINIYGDIEYTNITADVILHYKKNELCGMNIDELSGKPITMWLNSALQAGSELSVENQNTREIPKAYKEAFRAGTGNLVNVECSSTLVYDEDESYQGVVLVFQEASVRKFVQDQLANNASYDYLTDLPNRALFDEHLRRAILRADRNEKKTALLFIDIDNFKVVNECYSHICGDQVIKEIADRLCCSIRKNDIVCRVGGDEFAVILEDIYESDDVEEIAKGLLTNISKSIFVQDIEVKVTASIGIDIYPDTAQDSESLLKHADIAKFSVKEKGKNNFQYYQAMVN